MFICLKMIIYVQVKYVFSLYNYFEFVFLLKVCTFTICRD